MQTQPNLSQTTPTPIKAAEKAAEQVKRTVIEGASSAASQVGEMTDKLFEQSIEMKDKMLRYGSDYTRQVENMIRRRPLVSVAVAAGVGVVAMSIVLKAFQRKA